MFKIIVLILVLGTVNSAKYQCNEKSSIFMLKKPTYDFSIKILSRVARETDGHFVFSPLSTWIQLVSLSEGARGKTLRELWNVTKHHRLKCFRRKWKIVLNKMSNRLRTVSKQKQFMVIDKLMGVKTRFVREVQRLKSMKVLLEDFDHPVKAADLANKQVGIATNGVIPDAFTPDDFNYTVLLLADTSYYKSNWRIPFNPVYTSVEPFYSDNGLVQNVDMMQRIDYFNYTEIPSIKAKVLEIPCGTDNKVSMLLFLSTGHSLNDFFYYSYRIRIMTIFNKFKKEKLKMVKVKLPKFKITTDLDNIPELLYDMGVIRVFHPDLANLNGISDYKLYASLMTQVTDIDVNEKGVSASSIADFLLSNEKTEEFIANKPFAFMLVDRTTDIILFSGMYSQPSRYA